MIIEEKEFNGILKDVYKVKINEATSMLKDVSNSTLLEVLQQAFEECRSDLLDKMISKD